MDINSKLQFNDNITLLYHIRKYESVNSWNFTLQKRDEIIQQTTSSSLRWLIINRMS